MNVAQLIHQLNTKTNFTLMLVGGALIASRILPVIFTSPFLGKEAVPNEVKVGLGVVLAVVLFPAVSVQLAHLPLNPLVIVGLLLKEIFIGLCLSMVVNVIFDAAQVAGNLVDMSSGLQNAQMHVPQLQISVPLFSALKFNLAVVLFLTLNGHHVVIDALADSLMRIPLHTLPVFPHGMWTFFEFIIRLFGNLLRLGLLLSAPAFIATFLSDLALGLVNRVAPQVQVFFMSMALKPLVGTLFVMLSLGAIVEWMRSEFSTSLAALRYAISLLG